MALDIWPEIAALHLHLLIMLLVRVTVGVITQILVMVRAVILRVLAVLRTMMVVATRVPSFLPRDRHSSLKQLQATVLRGTEQAITTRVLGLKVAITDERDVRFMGISTP